MLKPKKRSSEWVLYFILAFSPLAVGTVHWWSMVVFQCAVLAAMTLALVFRNYKSWQYQFPAWLLAALFILTLLQLVPLPAGLLEILSPRAAGWYDFLLSESGGGYARPLSIAPIITALSAIKYITYFCLFVLAVNLFRVNYSDHKPLVIFSFLGFAGLVIAILQTLLKTDAVLGLVPLEYAKPRLFMSTFVNGNNQAAFSMVCGLISLGLYFSKRFSGSKKQFFLIASITSFIGVFLSFSRAGMFLFVPALLLFWFLNNRNAQSQTRNFKIVITATIAITIVGALYAATSTIVDELLTIIPWYEKSDFGKLDLITTTFPIIADFPLVGIGRGALPLLFPFYVNKMSSNPLMMHSENVWLQMLIDYGLIMGSAFMITLFGYLFYRCKHKLQGSVHSIDAAIVTALVYLAIHNLIDFNLEVPGVMVPTIFLIAHICRKKRFASKAKPKYNLAIPLTASIFLILSIIAGVTLRNDTIDKINNTLYSLVDKTDTDPDVFAAVFDSAVQKYPTNYYAYSSAAVFGIKHKNNIEFSSHVLKNLNKSLFLAPKVLITHIAVGDYLIQQRRYSQAAIEYEIAIKNTPSMLKKRKWLKQYLNYTKKPALFYSIADDNKDIKIMALQTLLEYKYIQATEKYMSEFSQNEQQTNPELLKLKVRLLDMQKRFEEAEKLADYTREKYPHLEYATVYKARRLFNSGKRNEAIALLKNYSSATLLSATTLAGFFSAMGEVEKISTLMREFPFNESLHSNFYFRRARAHLKNRETNKALADLKMAKILAPNNTKNYFEAARIHTSMNNWASAVIEYRKILKINPDNKAAKEKLDIALKKEKHEKTEMYKKLFLHNKSLE